MRLTPFISTIFLLGSTVLLNQPAFAESSLNVQEDKPSSLMAQSPSPIVLELGITDTQIFQLNEVREEYSPQVNDLYSEWLTAANELDALLVSETAVEADVKEQFQTVESLRSQLATAEFERELAIWKILEPEQRLPFEQYFEQLSQQ